MGARRELEPPLHGYLFEPGCSISSLEVMGEAVLIRKTEVSETQFQYIFRL